MQNQESERVERIHRALRVVTQGTRVCRAHVVEVFTGEDAPVNLDGCGDDAEQPLKDRLEDYLESLAGCGTGGEYEPPPLAPGEERDLNTARYFTSLPVKLAEAESRNDVILVLEELFQEIARGLGMVMLNCPATISAETIQALAALGVTECAGWPVGGSKPVWCPSLRQNVVPSECPDFVV